MKTQNLLIGAAVVIGGFILLRPAAKPEDGGMPFDIGGLFDALKFPTQIPSIITSLSAPAIPFLGEGIGLGGGGGLGGGDGLGGDYLGAFDFGSFFEEFLEGFGGLLDNGLDIPDLTVPEVIPNIPDVDELNLPDVTDLFEGIKGLSPKIDLPSIEGWEFGKWTEQGIEGVGAIGKAVDFVLGGWQKSPLGEAFLPPFEWVRDQFMQYDIVKSTPLGREVFEEAGITSEDFGDMSKEQRDAFFSPTEQKMEEMFTPEQLAFGQQELEKWVKE